MNNTVTLMHRRLVTLTSVLFVLAALGIGALFGHLTSPDAPAHAQVPDTCGLVCVPTNTPVTGGAGTIPGPLTGGVGQVDHTP